MKNWTIGKRITVGFATVISCIALIGGYTLFKLQAVREDSKTIAGDTLPCLTMVQQIAQLSANNRALVYRHIASSDPADMSGIESQMAKNSTAISDTLKEYEKTLAGEADRAAYEKVMAAREVYRDIQKETLSRSRAATNNTAAYEYALKELDPALEKYAAAQHELTEYEKANGERAASEIESAISALRIGFIVSTILTLIIASALATVIIRSVSSALDRLSTSLGDGAAQIASAASQVSLSSQTTAEGASEQAASLEETSASLEEIASMTKRNSENAGNCKSLSSQASTAAGAGLKSMHELTRTLDAIKAAVAEMQTAVSETQSSSQEISKIIKTIDEIAFQTNLLALNAAVEAARAGEAGAGFAVVADEVRSLAQRSAQAARDTSDKIEAAVKRSEQGGIANTKVVKSLTEVEATAQGIQQVFNGIVTQIQSVDQIVAEIAAASKEQSQGITEVNMAVSQMDKVTQANAANAEENAASSEELNAQAASMQDMVRQLEILTLGHSKAGLDQPPIHKPKKTAAKARSLPKLTVPADRDQAEAAFGASLAATEVKAANSKTEAKVGEFQNF